MSSISTPPIDVRAVAQSAFDALRRGDLRNARALFERLVAANLADASSCLGLAYACRGLDDHAAALAAVDRTLAQAPRDLRALIFKADQLARAGDDRNASSYYLFAVQTAPPPDQLPLEMRNELARAQSECDRHAARFEGFLRDQLARGDHAAARASDRFSQSLDILLGKKKLYLQQPRNYYFPELPQIQFYDRKDFPFFDRVEAATSEIRAELLEVMQQPSAFTPYVESDTKRPRIGTEGIADNPNWSAFHLWKNGEIVPENAARCPRTLNALADAPFPHIKHRSPSVMFSLLRPGTRIPPHNGLVNTRLICHLPLIVPPNCGLRVGNDTRTPVEGKAWLFDDTIEHEAWNLSDRTRVILLFEIWRPELTLEERGLVRTMFEAIDTYSGRKPDWEI